MKSYLTHIFIISRLAKDVSFVGSRTKAILYSIYICVLTLNHLNVTNVRKIFQVGEILKIIQAHITRMLNLSAKTARNHSDQT